ncbi:hypothetical protein Bbelb_203830 [Branchiostoma belcheri]|nr:hypothetical protein Bbelb_203830 [Branchiostoma belcheri]
MGLFVQSATTDLGQTCVQLELEHSRSLEQVVAGGGRHLGRLKDRTLTDILQTSRAEMRTSWPRGVFGSTGSAGPCLTFGDFPAKCRNKCSVAQHKGVRGYGREGRGRNLSLIEAASGQVEATRREEAGHRICTLPNVCM